jgi:hypothetical protein
MACVLTGAAALLRAAFNTCVIALLVGQASIASWTPTNVHHTRVKTVQLVKTSLPRSIACAPRGTLVTFVEKTSTNANLRHATTVVRVWIL